MKYTPGPWKLRVNPDENDRLRHLYFIDGPENGQPICEVRNYQKIGENNGSLIAAAPEMYEALKLILNAYEKWNNREDGGEDDLHYAARKVNAALYKATGK